MSNHPAQAGTSPNKDGISRPGGGHRPLAAPRPDRSTPSSVGTFHPAPNADGPHEGDAPLRFRVQEAWERLCRSVRPHVPVLALYGALKLTGFCVFMFLLDSTGDFRRKHPRFGAAPTPGTSSPPGTAGGTSRSPRTATTRRSSRSPAPPA